MDRGAPTFCFVVVAVLALASSVASVNVTTLAFDEGYVPLFGEGNLVRSAGGRNVSLLLNRFSGERFVLFLLRPSPSSLRVTAGFDLILSLCFFFGLSGSGFISKDMYYHGFFSASIKLPSDYTAGVVVAFYVSHCSTCRVSVVISMDYNDIDKVSGAAVSI
ncbi:hypothetical protein B296_00040330 [Ensete ventricosum]|uniref:GH16 domain-containing protein n=1 Tax=Ensete ventricosum TaxID=4639 RepID=A0A426XX58_ENSVE|nr:hypothetical protein B296_00040330 [Ensete ventricosum]